MLAPHTPATDLTTAAPLAPVPGYELTKLVGRGSYAAVYRATELASGRIVAVKLFRPSSRHDTSPARAFSREVDCLTTLRHPNVVRFRAAGWHANRHFLALEFCHGGDLRELLRNRKRFDPHAAAELVAALARGAAAAHEAGIVHRDIKPDNVLLAADGTPRLADFGLACRVGTVPQADGGELIGTPAYLSPEQADGSGRAFQPTADVWSLGVVLYECLTGQRPYAGGNLLAVLREVARAVPPVPIRAFRDDVPARLEAICLKCLRKDPADRYDSAAALAAALEEVLRNGPCPDRARFTEEPSPVPAPR